MTTNYYKLLICLYSIFFGSEVFAQEIVFNCLTDKHNIQITKIDPITYQYKSWNKPKAVTEKPDMDLKSKDVTIVGSGACRHTEYSFKTGKVEFLIDDDTKCLEGKPPANITGNLNIFINGDLKNHYYCLK